MNYPVYAAMGHPNEGKSSVISTLTEDESIRISPTPGETISCATYTLEVNSETVLHLVDTPGFQNPGAVLEWMNAWEGPESDLIQTFLTEHASLPEFHHDRELLSPLKEQTGILYVVDASRPLREVDRQEMEILRRTGLARLALLNMKTEERQYLNDWEEALSRRFNLVRTFNAHHASFAERSNLLDTLAELTPQHKDHLQQVKASLKEDWEHRLNEAALVLESLWLRALHHQTKVTLNPARPEEPQLEDARETYREEIRTFERKARREWRSIYQHPTLPHSVPQDSFFSQELFAEKVWKILGFTRKQLTTAGAVTGGALGAGVDVAAGGITFGIFTAAGLITGGISGWMGTPKLGAKKLPFPGAGPLAKEQIVVGPFKDPQLLIILLDRALLYLHRLMNWSHGRRDTEAFLQSLSKEDGLTRSWSDKERKVLLRWIKTHATPGHPKAYETSKELRDLVETKLRQS